MPRSRGRVCRHISASSLIPIPQPYNPNTLGIWPPQAAPREQAAAALLGNAAQRAALCSALCQCFVFDSAAAPLLLYSAALEAGTYAQQPTSALTSTFEPRPEAASPNSDAHTAEPLPSSPQNTGTYLSRDLPDSVSDRAPDPGQPPRAAGAGFGLNAALLLPRIPVALMYVASPRAYEALATVVRTLGRLAATADAASSGDLQPHQPQIL